MRNSIPALALPIVPVSTQLHGAAVRLQANRELPSASGTIPDDFLAALGDASVPDSLKINVSAVSPLKTKQSASVSVTTVPGLKRPVATAAAIGTVEKGAMLQKDGTSGKAEAVTEASVQEPSVEKTTLPLPDPAEPCVEKPDIALEPATAATSPARPPVVESSASHPVHIKAAARRDADADPAVAVQATGLKPDPVLAVPLVAVPMITTMVPQQLPAAPSPAADTSSHLHASSRSAGDNRGPTLPHPAEDVTASAADTAGADVTPRRAGGPGASAILPRSAGAAPHEPRQGKLQTMPAATLVSTTSGAASPTLHHADIASSQHLLSMMVSAPGGAASATVMPTVAGVPQPDPSALPPGNTASTAAPLAAPATGSVQAATTQVAPALVSLMTRTDGSHEMTVSLNPRDLGQVEVHLVRNSDGTTAVTITASRPDVLQELLQNVHHLHAALDAANIPTDGRVMNFMTAAAASELARNDLAGRDSSARQDSSGRASTGEDFDQNPGQGRAGQQDQPRHTARDANDDNSPYRSMASVASRRNWQLSGLNITA